MKKLFMPVLFFGTLFTSCSKDDVIEEEVKPEEVVVEEKNLEVESFIYGGMNEIYLYKADVPVLADDYFLTSSEKKEFLSSFDSPERLYEDLQSSQDKFSFMTSDYVALRKLLSQGIAGTTGMDYGLVRFSNSDNIFGYVRYVLPGTSAAQKDIKRGDVFTEINGQTLNIHNYSDLLGLGSYSVRIATISNNTISQTDRVVTLTKQEIAEDPVFLEKVIETGGKKIGYLMYNSFTPDFDAKLNSAFANLKAQGITDLVLDLRYNSGGDVETATDLASMITGQLNDQVLIKYQFNQKYQNHYEKNDPEYLLKRFNDKIRGGEAINSLQLSKVYVLTTRSSASASELVIHGLKPYIEVVQIGVNTRGKFQASTTLYDSPNFRYTNKEGVVHANPNHTYAIQPLIIKYANSKGESDFVNGLSPNFEVKEDLNSLGILGDPSETLLRAAINAITGTPQEEVSASLKRAHEQFKFVGESDMFKPNYQRMYLDDIELPLLKLE